MRNRKFPILEILIGIAALCLLYIILYPQYRRIEATNKEMATKLNMYAVKVAVENYAAYKQGVFPDSVGEFSQYLEGGYVNPCTKELIDSAQIMVFSYKNHGDNKDNSPESANRRMRGEPGKIGYGTFIPPGATTVAEYGIIGFGEDGSPITILDPAGKKLVFLLHD